MPIPFRQESRATIRRRVGYLMHGRDKFLYGTLTSGGAASVVLDAAKRWPDDYFTGSTLYAVSGTGAGQQREISDHVQSSGTLSLSVNASPAFDATTVVEIWPAGTDPDVVNNNINLAIIRASDIVNIYTEAPATAIDSTRFILTPPTTMVKVCGVYYYENGIMYDFAPMSWSDTQGEPGFMMRGAKLYMNRYLSTSVGDSNILVQGYRLPALLAADTDLAEVRSDYLVYMAAFYMDAGQAEGPALDPEQHSGRAGQWLKEALAIEPRMITNWLPNTQEVRA